MTSTTAVEEHVYDTPQQLQKALSQWPSVEDMPEDFMPSVVEEDTYAVHHWKIPAKVFTVHVKVDTERKELECWAQKGPFKGGLIKIGPNGGTQRIGMSVAGFKLLGEVSVKWSPSLKVTLKGEVKIPPMKAWKFTWSHPS